MTMSAVAHLCLAQKFLVCRSFDAPSDRVFNVVQLVLQVCKGIRSAPTGLGAFIRRSLEPSNACNVDGDPPTSLWPVPPVRRWTDCRRLNPRRRRRHQLLRAQHELLNVVICSLNWESMGFPTCPPGRAQLGAPITVQQHAIIERLEALIGHFLRQPSFTGDDLGRAKDKFTSVIKSIQELPWCQLRYEDLTELALQVEATLDPYGSQFRPSRQDSRVVSEDTAETPSHQCRFESFPASTPLDNPTGAMPVRSERVKWKCPPSFEAAQFLNDPLLKSAYEDPEVLRKPPEMWSKSSPAKVRCSKSEFLKLAKRWDDLGACCLIDADSKDYSEAVGLFCVPKDAQNDRLIVNPQVINSRMFSLASATKELAPGCLLAMLHLDPPDMFRFNADDLSDYYYTFKVSKSRAFRNAFRLKLHADDVRNFNCYDPALEGKTILLCLKTLAMGDNLAVEIAQAAHATVLRVLCSAMRSHEVLKYRWPIPRGDFIELLAIDDHVGIQRLPIRQYPKTPKLRDTEVFDEATKAYSRVGLVLHEKKQKRNLTQGTILGADFDGREGRVMAPRHRIAVLCLLSMVIAIRGTCAPKLLSIMLGCWVHVLLFRRALFAIIDDLFREGRGLRSDQPFCLSRQARNELLMLAALGPTAQSDLRANYSDQIFMTDASPTWGAVCQAPVTEAVTAELWRHSEQRGFYTRLKDPAGAVLAELGLPSASDEHFAHDPYNSTDSPYPDSIPKPIKEGILFDCCEIFRGTGNWTSVHASRGLTCHDGFDVDGRRLRCGDLASRSVFAELIGLAARGVVREWHAGLPCVSFGTLRRPQVRSKAKPYGFNPKDPFTAYHNLLAMRTAFTLTVAVMLGQFISVEQPRNSRLFLLNCFKTLVQLGCVISHFAFCAFGSGFQKASKWLHNKPWLIPLECSCRCPKTKPHFIIQGNFIADSVQQFDRQCEPSCMEVYGSLPKSGSSVASFSAAYPLRLVHQMASGALAAQSGVVPPMPYEVKLRSLKEVGLVDASVACQSHEPSFPKRPWFENPEWHHELCEFLHFREVFRYKFKLPGHINVNEMRTYKSWIKSMAKSSPDSRFVGLLDSRVTIGAAAKGRSSSYALTRVLKGSMAYVIGGGLYPGLLHCYSQDNRADDPTRHREVRGPTRKPPGWFEALERGDPSKFDCVNAAAQFSKNPARWLRFLLLLAGDIEPNPGPRKSGPPPRGPLDLRVGFAPVTAQRMERCLQLFSDWCDDELQIPVEKLTTDWQAFAMALLAYGMFCFETGMPRYQFVYAITAVQDRWPQARPWLAPAWHVDRKWQVHEPGSCRAVLPPSVIRAAACIAAIWGWLNWAAMVLLGFSAMLHPSELLALCRKDLIFPSDVSFDCLSLFVRVRDPKTARFARRQHGRVDDSEVIHLLEELYGGLPPASRLYPGSMAIFRRQWNAVMGRLGIPVTQSEHGATPGVLRGSGATYLYHQTRT